MGKDKSGQRTKKNVRPSSSGRSAEMLGSAPINPFMSFTTLKESMGVDEQMSDSHLDPNFQVVLKKMNKKDGITKLKALQEFSQLCGSAEPDQVVAILPFWPRLYSLLALDVEHRVREAAHVAHRAVVSKVKRNIAPYLKQLAGPWFVAQCDTYAPAASAATICFNEAFPPQKLSEAIAYCQEEILNYIYENLVVHTPQTLCNAKTMTPEEIESKYIRTVTSSLQGYGLYLTRLTSAQLQGAKDLNKKLVSDAKFWKLSKHESAQIRSAWFGAVIALCQHAQFLLSGEEKRMGLAIFGSLDESDATVLPVVWEAALVALVAMDGLLEVVSFEKLLLPKLLRVCREGGKGSAAAIFPSLLPLLSKMPTNIVRDTSAFHDKFFSSIRQGFSQKAVRLSPAESKAVANSFVECLQYVIQLNQDNESMCLELLQHHLLPCLQETIENSNQAPHCSALYLSLSRLLKSWDRNPDGSLQRKLVHHLCHDVLVALESMSLQEKTAVVTLPSAASDLSDDIVRESDQISELREGSPPRHAALRDVLQSQVDFISCLLEKQVVRQKVKFSDKSPCESLEATPEDSKTMINEVPNQDVLNLGKNLCGFFLKITIKSECVDYMSPLASLIKVVNSPDIYSDLAKLVNLTRKEDLFSEHFIGWLKPHSPLFCHAAFSLSIPLLPQLPIKLQADLLDKLLEGGINVRQLMWILEENTLRNNAAINWLRSSKLAPVLRTLTEEASSSLDNSTETWDLLSSGFSIAKDGDHVFCSTALEEILDVVLSHLESVWHCSSVLPMWTSAAAKTLTKVYTDQSPFLRSWSSPERALSIAFKVCLWEHSSPHIMALSQLWRSGTKAVARVHGPFSTVIRQLCSSFDDAVLLFLHEKLLHSKADLVHIASQLADFVEIVMECFSDVDDDDQKRSVCSKLLEYLFLFTVRDYEDNKQEVSGLRDILRSHRLGLESLADCVEPFHSGVDSSKEIPCSPLTELVGAGYWGAIVAFVLHRLASSLEVTRTDIGECNVLFSTNILLDTFVLLSDVKYNALHFSFTELGSALQQLTSDIDSIFQELFSVNVTEATKIHEILQEKSSQSAMFQRAHKTWHSYIPSISSCGYHGNTTPPQPVDDGILHEVDLSSLGAISERLLAQGLCDEIKPHVLFWIDVVYKLHIRHNARFVTNTTIDLCSIAVVHDTARVMKFLDTVVLIAPELLGGRNWDQIMIGMAMWIHCAYDTIMGNNSTEGSTPRFSRKVCSFLHEVCKLYFSFNQTLSKLGNGSITLVDPERASLKDSLPREWRDVFAGECGYKILAMWSDIVENIKPSAESPPLVALLHQLGQALQICGTEFLQSSSESEVVYEPLLKLAPAYLLHNIGSVRLTAFHLLYKIVPYMVKHDAASFSNISNAEVEGKEHIQSEEKLSLLQLEDVLTHAQTVVSTMLSDIRLGTSCTVQPFTDSYTYTSGYLLVWSIILEMCRAAETELTCQYAIWLKNTSENYAETFLNNVFRLLPQEAFNEKAKKPLDYYSQPPCIAVFWTSSLVEHMACNALYGILSQLPGLVRQWWTNSDPKSATLIERVVCKNFSPYICEEEMSAVAKMQDKTVENMSVRVHSNVREVVATYTVDDLTMELVVRLPTNHPLSPMIVEVGKRNAAAAAQWRQWLMQLTMFLTHQNGTLWDGLALWRNNVVRKYEGVEECYICFCVLSGSNYQLPKLSCRTCRKKFHSTCLYKWFQTSHKSTCPICRNLF